MKDQNGKPITEKEFMEGESLRVEGEFMTSNKHKEIMDEWDRKWKTEGEFISFFEGKSRLSEQKLRDFLSSTLLQQLEELERWVEGRMPGECDCVGASFECEHWGRHEELQELLSHIREQKEIIKNV